MKVIINANSLTDELFMKSLEENNLFVETFIILLIITISFFLSFFQFFIPRPSS